MTNTPQTTDALGTAAQSGSPRTHETRRLKAALAVAGLDGVRIRHGRNTAWGWLDLDCGDGAQFGAHVGHEAGCRDALACDRCWHEVEMERVALRVALAVTGRDPRFYDGRINVSCWKRGVVHRRWRRQRPVRVAA